MDEIKTIKNTTKKHKKSAKKNTAKKTVVYGTFKDLGFGPYLYQRLIRTKSLYSEIAKNYEEKLAEKSFNLIEDVKFELDHACDKEKEECTCTDLLKALHEGHAYLNSKKLRMKIVCHIENEETEEIRVYSYFFRTEEDMNDFIENIK